MITAELKGPGGGQVVLTACDGCNKPARKLGTHARRALLREQHWCRTCNQKLFPYVRTVEHKRVTSITTRAAMAKPDVKMYLLENQPDRTGSSNSFYGKTHTDTTRKKISENNAYAGRCNPWWHPWMLERRKEWGNIIKKCFNYACADCNETHRLEAHHIAPVHTSPELQYDLNNGIALCRPCHRLAHALLKEDPMLYQRTIQRLIDTKRRPV